MNKNVVATINLNVYKDVFLNNKCIRHSINRNQCKNHRIERNFIVNKNSLSCFDDKIYFQNNGYDGLPLG